MNLDHRILLAQNIANPVAAIQQGVQTAGMATDLSRQNALDTLYQEQGPQIAAGQQNALDAVARVNPFASLGVQTTRLGMDATRATMQQARESGARAAQEHAMKLTAEQRRQEIESTSRLVRAGYLAYKSGNMAEAIRIGTELTDGQPVDENNVLMVFAAGEGGIATMNEIATSPVFAPPPTKPPISVAAGSTLIDPDTLQPIYTAPARDSAKEQQVARLVSTGIPKNIAIGIADGRYVVSDGMVFDKASGDVVGSDLVQGPTTSSVPSADLYNRAPDATGLGARARQAAANTIGQVPLIGGLFDFPDEVQAQQAYRTATNELIRALSINPRFPVAEMERIRNEMGFDPSIWRSPNATQNAMIELDRYLASKVEFETDIANTPGIPMSERVAAQRAVRDMERFRETLGVPQGGEESSPEDTPPPEALNNPILMRSAERNDVSVEAIWRNLTPEQRERLLGTNQ